MAGRCYGCCQENCNFKSNCSCPCHNDERVRPQAIEIDCPKPVSYTFYAVADRDDLKTARWYRTYSSRGSSGWVNDLDDAKVWTKRGSAKGKCTSLGGTARIVEFLVNKVNVVDNSEHLKKVAERRRLDEENRQKREAQAALAQAQVDFDRAKKRLDSLTPPRKHDDDCGCKSCCGM